jgi:hypothetical protein
MCQWGGCPPVSPLGSQFWYLGHVERNHLMDQVYSYVTNWKEGKVNQMFIQQVTPEWQECGHQYVAVALNPETNKSMVMSKPRSHYDTLQWVRRFCGSFSLLY